MLALYRLVGLIAPTDAPTVVIGETGTGKELVANALHQLSGRAAGPFIAVNCAAIPETLAEAELFGVERGAFTGAREAKPGRVELAHEGTLFLDEICSAPLTLQAKLLRTLETGEVWRVGGHRARLSQFRVVAAAADPLAQLVTAGRLREDLAFRLAVAEVSVAPLRDRRSDIPLLATHFAAAGNGRGRQTLLLPDALDALVAHPWPGNVRQLRAMVERSTLLARGPAIDATLVRDVLRTSSLVTAIRAVAGTPLRRDAAALADLLQTHGGNLTQAARALRVARSTLRRWVVDAGLPIPHGVGRPRVRSARNGRSPI